MIAILGNEGKTYKECQKEAEQLGDEKREMGEWNKDCNLIV